MPHRDEAIVMMHTRQSCYRDSVSCRQSFCSSCFCFPSSLFHLRALPLTGCFIVCRRPHQAQSMGQTSGQHSCRRLTQLCGSTLTACCTWGSISCEVCCCMRHTHAAVLTDATFWISCVTTCAAAAIAVTKQCCCCYVVMLHESSVVALSSSILLVVLQSTVSVAVVNNITCAYMCAVSYGLNTCCPTSSLP